jgi:glycosyltransferase involved in cell wall biosynthesis
MTAATDVRVAGGDRQATWPTVTAVIPTRDRPEMLRRAVAAVLDQDYAGDIECVVVFDQSDPAAIDVPLRPGRTVRVIRNNRTPGLAGARNSGVDAATGELVAFCDDDDEWLPPKLRRQVELLRTVPDTSVVVSGVCLVSGDNEIVRLPPPRALGRTDFLRDRIAAVHPSTVLVRRDRMVREIGPVDERLPGSYAEDYEWLLRAAAIAPVRSVSAPYVKVNWTPSSFFAGRWGTIATALQYLLDKHPDFARERRGRARIRGQIAFALGALGERRAALRWAARAWRDSPREPRAYLTALVVLHLVTATRITTTLQRHGRGI